MVSNLSSTELTLALDALGTLRRSVQAIEVDTDEGTPGPDNFLLDDLDNIISQLGSRLGQLSPLGLPGEDEKILSNHNIQRTGSLMLKHDYQQSISADVQMGNEKLWSSSAMYAHLTMLENSVDISDRAGASLWTDAFFFRVSAMVPSSHHLILHPERHAPSALYNASNLPVTRHSEITYYTAIITNREIAPIYMYEAPISAVETLQTGLFVFEAKETREPLSDKLRQVVYEVYQRAIHLKQHIVRGALTSGRRWIFVILYLNKNGLGACYKISDQVEYGVGFDRELGYKRTKILGDEPDLIASILLRWARQSFTGLDEDDFFYEFPVPKP